MSTPTLKVRDWDSLYENHRSRELKKLEYVPVKNKMDGDGYAFLMEHKNGAAHLGAWVAILQIASRCKERGVLVGSDGCPYDTAALSRISRIPKKIFDEAIPRLVGGCKWMEHIEAPAITQVPAVEARDERGMIAEKREIGAGSSRHVRACDSLPLDSITSLPVILEIPEIAKLDQGLLSEESPIESVLAELDETYRQAGAPIPEKHRQLIAQFLVDVPLSKFPRITAYPKWALKTGKWPNPGKTKAMINVLRDGDWDIELMERTFNSSSIPTADEVLRQADELDRQDRERRRAASAAKVLA
jgi:hypothetical protein